MISKLSSSTPSYTPRAQDWSTTNNTTNNTSETPSTEKAAWGVETKATEKPPTKPVERELVEKKPKVEKNPKLEETPIPKTTPKITSLNPLAYDGLDNTFNNTFKSPPIAFNPPALNTPQAIDTWNTFRTQSFMPANPDDILKQQTLSFNTTPNLNTNSLGSNMFSNILGSLGLS
jgi:hypothetical protein